MIRGIAADGLGNVYLCDNTNSRIVQTNTTGTVSSVLYSNTGCGEIALDGAGNLLVADTSNNRILLLPNENGAINGNDALVIASGFSTPRGINIDGFGNVVVADTVNARVVVAPIGGALPQNVPTFSNLKSPYDAAIDWQGNIAVTDTGLSQVAYLPANGSAASVIGPVLCSPMGHCHGRVGRDLRQRDDRATVVGCGRNVHNHRNDLGEDVIRITPNSTFFYQVDGHATNADAVALDPQGNLYTIYGGALVVQNRTSLPLTFSSAVGSAERGANRRPC